MKPFQDFIIEKLELHRELNPQLWEGETLKPDVRAKLLLIGQAWAEYAKVPTQLIKDYLLRGGNANYNYTDHSDIDVHLLLDRSALGFGPVVDEYLKDKKELWSLTHKPKVKGYDVELYAQDLKEPASSGQGIYSLSNNSWILKPAKPESFEIDDTQANRKADDLKSSIDRFIGEDDYDAVVDLKKKIANMRKAGISAGGEFAPENLAFKILRNDGYLQKMTDYLSQTGDTRLSLY